jgi:heptosyltransferase I
MRRLLVLRLSALGDVIHTIPAVAALRETRPDTRISWVVEAPYRELVELVAGVETIPVRMKKWGRSLFASRGEMRTALRTMRGADESIDFQGLMKSAMLGWLAGAKTRTGFDIKAIREKPALLFTHRKVEVDTTLHVVDQNLALAQSKIQNPKSKMDWEAFPLDTGLDAFASSIVLLPGAGRANKLWPVDRFREVARLVGERALVVWGPGERELAESVGVRMAPPTSLRELAWILRHARLVIGGDTGPLHLAAALGTKVIGLYGPTDPRRNGPYGQLDHCVDHFRSTKWMESIRVEDVMEMVQRVANE